MNIYIFFKKILIIYKDKSNKRYKVGLVVEKLSKKKGRKERSYVLIHSSIFLIKLIFIDKKNINKLRK